MKYPALKRNIIILLCMNFFIPFKPSAQTPLIYEEITVPNSAQQI